MQSKWGSKRPFTILSLSGLMTDLYCNVDCNVVDNVVGSDKAYWPEVKKQSRHWTQREKKIIYTRENDRAENRKTTSDLDRNAVCYIVTNY